MAPREETRTIHVLSIEDNPGDALLIEEKLADGTRMGWGLPRIKVTWVDRLKKGLTHLRAAASGEAAAIDAVLTDLDLPDSRAGATVATLRRHAPHIPIVVLTGREDESLARASVRAGVQDYLYKNEATGGLLAHALIYAIERQENQQSLQQAHDALEARVAARTADLVRANEHLHQANRALEAEVAERERVERHIAHLNRVMQAIRNVNQLIVKETDRDRLIRRACESLTETRGYHNVWIVLFDEAGDIDTAAESGLGADFDLMLAKIKRDGLTTCGRRARSRSDVITTAHPVSACDDCPLAEHYADRGAMTVRIEYADTTCGILTVSTPADYVQDEEEQALLQEVAGDIAFALHNIKLTHTHRRAEQALQTSMDKFGRFIEQSHDGMLLVDEEGIVVEWNPALERIVGITPDEALGRPAWDVQYRTVPEAKRDEAMYRRMKAAFQQFLATGEAPWLYKPQEATVQHRDGTIRTTEQMAFPIQTDQGFMMGSIFRDITGLQRARTQMGAALDALWESERRFRMAVLHSGIIFAHTDRDLRYTWIYNPHPDFPPEAAIGKRDEELADNPGTRQLTRLKQRVLDTERTLREDITFPLSDGQRVYDVTAEPIQDETGYLTGIVTCALDVTHRARVESERKEAIEALRRTERRFRKLFEGIQTGIAIANRDGEIQAANPFLCRWLGYTEEEIQRLTIADITHPEDLQREEALIREMRQGRRDVVRLDKRYVTKQDEIVWGDLVTNLVYDDEGNYLFELGTVVDITARKRTALDLARTNRELARFGYVVSHDLQEPAHLVQRYLQLLQRRYHGQLDDRANRFIDYAVDGAERIQAMIAALLDLSRVDTRGRDFTPIDVEVVLDRTLKGLARVIHETGADVTHDPLPTVLADEVQLGQVLQHLIANAVKFHREGVPPRVHIAAVHSPPARSPRRGEDSTAGGEWRFSITDNGIGIPPDQADRIFQIFQRLHTEAEYEGLGIGLALCKRIVARHGGRIWVASQPGEGARFYFTLPASPLPSGDDKKG